MNVRELAVKAAEMCLAADADRWADIAAFVWEKRLLSNSVYAGCDEDISLFDRWLNTIFGFMAFGCYQEKAQYIKGLLTIVELARYQHEHDINTSERIERVKAELSDKVGVFPDVETLLTIEQAESMYL